MPTTAKRLILCADDYAQNAAVSEGILTLLRASRLNAVSCLVNMPVWPEYASALKVLEASKSTAPFSVGLHFNLTWGEALSDVWRKTYGKTFPSLLRLLSWIYTGQLCLEAVAAEWHAQWECFVQAKGKAPDFVDGHQHVHQYRGIRSVCCAQLKAQAFRGWCRSTSNGGADLWSRDAFPKPAAMWLLGGARLRRQLSQVGIQTNTTFAGFYPFSQPNYRDHFRRFLARSHDGGVIMCHPGDAASDLQDPLYQSRHHEYAYFASEHFLRDLQEYGFAL